MSGSDDSIFDSDTPLTAGLDLGRGVRAEESAVKIRFSRSGGPGGQNVNKVNTKADLWVMLSGITGMNSNAIGRLRALAGKRFTLAGEIHIVSETGRTQESNRAMAIQRLRDLVAAALIEPKPRKKTRPTKASKRRRIEGKKRRSEVKENRRRVE